MFKVLPIKCNHCNSKLFNRHDDYVECIDCENLMKYEMHEFVEDPKEFVLYLDEIKSQMEFDGWEFNYYEPKISGEEGRTDFYRLIGIHKNRELHFCLCCGLDENAVFRNWREWEWGFHFCPFNAFDKWGNSKHITKTYYRKPSLDSIRETISMASKINDVFKIPEEISFVEIS